MSENIEFFVIIPFTFIGCFVFFPEVNKTNRLYKIEKFDSKNTILNKITKY